MNLPEIDEGQVKPSIKNLLDPYDAKIALIAGNKLFIKHSNEDSAHVVISRLTGCEVLGIKLNIKFCDEENLNEMNKYISQNKDNINNKNKTKKIIVFEHEWENYPDISNLTDKRFGRMSVLKGMSTQVNDNLTNKVKEFVASWHSSRINPDFIKSVSLNKYSKSATEKNDLLVESPDEYSCETIIEEAKQYLQNCMKWELYYIQECKSMIKGLSLTNNDNLTTYIKNMVAKWCNPTVDPDIIIKVENERKHKGSNEKKNKTLWVTAANPEKNVELLKAAKSNIQLDSMFRWYYSKPINLKISNNIAREISLVPLSFQTDISAEKSEIVYKKNISQTVTNLPFAIASTSKDQISNFQLRIPEIEPKDCRLFTKLDPDTEELLLCKICTGIFIDPKELNKCRHTFCGKCLDYNKETNTKCYICGRDYKNEDISPPSIYLESVLQRLFTICKFAVNGCKDVMPIKSFTFHYKNCKFNPTIKNSRNAEIVFESPECIIKKLYVSKSYFEDIIDFGPFEFVFEKLNDYGPIIVSKILSEKARVKIGDILFQINDYSTFNRKIEEFLSLLCTIDYQSEIEIFCLEFLDPQIREFSSERAKMIKCLMKLFDKNLLQKIGYFNKDQIEEINKNMEKFDIDRLWRVMITKGTYKNRPVWHIVLHDKESLPEFFENLGNIYVTHYGKILKSGWCTEPPQHLSNEKYLVNIVSQLESTFEDNTTG